MINTLKAKLLEARKNKGNTAFWSFVLAEVTNVGKNKGNRETTSDEAISVIKKLVEKSIVASEKQMLEELLPKMATKEQVQEFVATLDSQEIKVVMPALKKKFGAAINLKEAQNWI